MNFNFSVLLLLISFSSFSQKGYGDHELIKGQEYHIKTTFEDKPVIGDFVKSDSTGIFVETANEAVIGVPFHMITWIKTRRIFLKTILMNNPSSKGYLYNINDDEITIDTKEGKVSLKLKDINKILVKREKAFGGPVAIGSLTMGLIFIGPVSSGLSSEEKILAGGGGVVLGALGGLIVGGIRSLPKKTYKDVQMFLNDFEPWLKGESTIPKNHTRLVKISWVR